MKLYIKLGLFLVQLTCFVVIGIGHYKYHDVYYYGFGFFLFAVIPLSVLIRAEET